MLDLEQEHNPFHTVVDGLSIEVHAHPAVDLALVHNGVPLITSVEVVYLRRRCRRCESHGPTVRCW